MGPHLWGPHYLGGAGFFHLYDEQGYGQVKLFLKCWRSPDSIQGKLLQITMAWAQFCVGTSTPILSETTNKLPHLEAEGLPSMRQYMKDVEGTIELEESFVAPLQREQDEFLMDIALQSGRFKPAEIKRVNYCRLYLNVLLVSDIATAIGDFIDPLMYSGMATPVSTKHSVNQPKPNKKAWCQWRRLMRMLTATAWELKLKKPLGKWIVPWDQKRCDWPFLYDSSSDKLF
jgi:hypothetical protein